jgi:hypothetical protein
MRVEWLPWGDEAFARAEARAVPILLFLEASWCRWCKQLERETLSDPRVIELVGRRFVPVRVDKDRRPDIDARYSKGGWPTLAYLDQGGESLAVDSYLEAPALLRRLELVSGYFREQGPAIRRRLVEAVEAAEKEQRVQAHAALDPEIVEWTTQHLLETTDPQFGGWGKGHKFAHAEALDFALIRWSETGNEALLKLVLRTLRQAQEGEIHDRVEGGFYRFATKRDWSSPHFEKVLDSNAQRLFLYAEAHQALGEDSFARTARGIAAWLAGTLHDPRTGAFRGSQDADEEYARAASPAARRARAQPPVDATIFANWNAMAVSALLKASVVLREPSYEAQALGALGFVVDEMIDPQQGVFHYWDETFHMPGLLADQALVLRALVDAYQYAGDPRWLAQAEILADATLATLHSPEGGFFDVRHDPLARGSLRRRERSILDNAQMAEALLRLAHLTRRQEFADVARETLQAFAGDYRRYGPFVAGYARAVDLFLHPPVHVTIVGQRGAAQAEALRAAALRPYVASRIVQVLDPSAEPEVFERSGLHARADAGGVRAFLERGRESFADTDDPRRLVALMTRVEG